MRRRHLLAALPAAPLLATAQGRAQGLAAPAVATPATPATLPRTTQQDIGMAGGGPPWRIFLQRPAGDPPARGWPVLYLLDANAVMGIAADIMRVQSSFPLGTGIQPAVLVGIGYLTNGAYDSVRRSWDYSPPPGRSYPPHAPGGPEVRTGGADRFLGFIEEVLKPWVGAQLPVDSANQAIFGHSFGGLFVLHALFNQPTAFRSWVAASPSIWWEDEVVLQSERHYAALPPGQRPPGRLLLSVGGYEQQPAPFQARMPETAAMAARAARSRLEDHARDLAGRLNALPATKLSASFELYPGETHMSVLPTALNHAIRFAFGPDAG